MPSLYIRQRANSPMSAAERDKCGLTSLFPMSCRDRAEAFARHLHSRLRSLGSEDGRSSADESSWLAAHDAPVAVSHQPRHASDSELCFDFGLLDSPGSPEEECPESELARLITNHRDNLSCRCSAPPANNGPKAPSHDSDSSDGPYYDTESELPHRAHYQNGLSSSDSDKLLRKQDNCQCARARRGSKRDQDPEEPDSPQLSESTAPPHSLTLSEEDSTLSLRDEDYPSLEFSSTAQELPCNGNGEEGFQIREHTPTPPQVDEPETSGDHIDVPVPQPFEEDDEVLQIETLEVTEQEYPVEDPEVTEGESVPACEVSSKIEQRNLLQVSSAKCLEDDDDDDKDDKPQRVRRCSSLKTGKTPPGTPGRKKIVRFADVLGLDLADVRTFLDEIPKVPNSAYDDLTNADLRLSASDSALHNLVPNFHPDAGHKPAKILLPLFQQPGGMSNFLDMVREKNVCLENAVVDDPVDLSIAGTVRVRNLDFHKSVHIRYTLDSWKSFADLQGTYVPNSCDGFSDKYMFLLYAHTLTIGQRLEFAVRFQCKGSQYWDNNYGSNYCFQCLPATNNSTFTPNTTEEHWTGATFY